METKTFNYSEFEKDMIEQFRLHYPSWQSINTKDMEICDDGTICIGAMQFKTDIKLTDYPI